MTDVRRMGLTFLGAAGTVTGSRYLITTNRTRILVDCGLFQGLKQLRLRNRDPFPVPPGELDAVILTHAHLDHSGYLPALVRDGFGGPVLATAATGDLCGLLLPDSGHLLEEEAEFANRHGTSKHHPALPLYTELDAERALERFVPLPFHEAHTLEDLTFRFRRAGHIPGAATVELMHEGTTVVFSGDLGRPHDPLLPAPESVEHADWVVVESTYGDRLHPEADPEALLGEVVRRTVARGGVVVIPAFAVGRAQSILYHLHALRARGEIPDVPVFIDSPMAARATDLLRAHPGETRLGADASAAVYGSAVITRSVEESKAIDRRVGPMIVISASGMATGGRVLFHLERFAPDHRNTVLFVGHQAAGTRGEALLRGERRLKIHGRYVTVRAEVVPLDGLSAHADQREILDWLAGFRRPPRQTFVTHGEPIPSDVLRRRIEEELGWPARVPEWMERIELGG
jgi:metallo-beta-lactamase family protein